MYDIDDLEGFSDTIRREVVSSHGLEDDERYVTTCQIMGYIAGRFPENEGSFVLDDNALEDVVKFAVGTLIGSCMSSMAAEGELECAWNEEQNDMVWWLPEGTDRQVL